MGEDSVDLLTQCLCQVILGPISVTSIPDPEGTREILKGWYEIRIKINNVWVCLCLLVSGWDDSVGARQAGGRGGGRRGGGGGGSTDTEAFHRSWHELFQVMWRVKGCVEVVARYNTHCKARDPSLIL